MASPFGLMEAFIFSANVTLLLAKSIKFTTLSKLVTSAVLPSGVMTTCSGRVATGIVSLIWNGQVEMRVTSASVWFTEITSGKDFSQPGGVAGAGSSGTKGNKSTRRGKNADGEFASAWAFCKFATARGPFGVPVL